MVQGKGIYRTQPCEISIVSKPDDLLPSPREFNENIPHTWLRFDLTEGKKRQIRKMCKAVRHRCLRLIRTSINDLTLGNMLPGEVKEIERNELFQLLKLET
jgi:23S rRNA pseudouridine2457 synthase